jgi:uncharacterized membrane protein YkvI
LIKYASERQEIKIKSTKIKVLLLAFFVVNMIAKTENIARIEDTIIEILYFFFGRTDLKKRQKNTNSKSEKSDTNKPENEGVIISGMTSPNIVVVTSVKIDAKRYSGMYLTNERLYI